MRLDRWDFAVVGAVAILSAAMFAGLGSGQAGAGGPKEADRVRLALGGAAEVELGGCRVAARAEGTPTADADSVVLVSARNPGAEPATLHFTLVIEKQEMNPAAAMSRRISAADFKLTKVAEQSVALRVEPGATGQARAVFRLPAGSYTASALDAAGKKTALCALPVAAAKPLVAAKGAK